MYVVKSDTSTFEVLIGTNDGSVYHACLMISPDANSLIEVEEFTLYLMNVRTGY